MDHCVPSELYSITNPSSYENTQRPTRLVITGPKPMQDSKKQKFAEVRKNKRECSYITEILCQLCCSVAEFEQSTQKFTIEWKDESFITAQHLKDIAAQLDPKQNSIADPEVKGTRACKFILAYKNEDVVVDYVLSCDEQLGKTKLRNRGNFARIKACIYWTNIPKCRHYQSHMLMEIAKLRPTAPMFETGSGINVVVFYIMECWFEISLCCLSVLVPLHYVTEHAPFYIFKLPAMLFCLSTQLMPSLYIYCFISH